MLHEEWGWVRRDCAFAVEMRRQNAVLVQGSGSPLDIRDRRGPDPVRHPVGDGLTMTVAEIARETGIGLSAAYGRIARGDTGSALLRRDRSQPRSGRLPPASVSSHTRRDAFDPAVPSTPAEWDVAAATLGQPDPRFAFDPATGVLRHGEARFDLRLVTSVFRRTLSTARPTGIRAKRRDKARWLYCHDWSMVTALVLGGG